MSSLPVRVDVTTLLPLRRLSIGPLPFFPVHGRQPGYPGSTVIVWVRLHPGKYQLSPHRSLCWPKKRDGICSPKHPQNLRLPNCPLKTPNESADGKTAKKTQCLFSWSQRNGAKTMDGQKWICGMELSGKRCQKWQQNNVFAAEKKCLGITSLFWLKIKSQGQSKSFTGQEAFSYFPHFGSRTKGQKCHFDLANCQVRTEPMKALKYWKHFAAWVAVPADVRCFFSQEQNNCFLNRLRDEWGKRKVFCDRGAVDKKFEDTR